MLTPLIRLHQQGRLDEAEQGYRAHLETHPDDGEALHLLALVLHQRHDREQAQHYVQLAHARMPEHAGVLATMAALQGETGDLEGAKHHCAKALAQDPNLRAAHAGLGQIALMEGDLSRAEQHFRTTLRAGESAQALSGLGVIQRERGDVEGALRFLSRAAELAPNDVKIKMLLGETYLAKGTHAFAEQAFAECLRLQPQLHGARQQLGRMLLLDGRLDEADAHFQALVSEPEFRVPGLLGRADVARAQGRLDAAIEHYRSALVMAPQMPRVVGAVADALQRSGRGAEAIAECEDYLERFPGDRKMRGIRAEILIQSGRTDEGAAEIEQLHESDPADANVTARVALLREWLGQLDGAEQAAELAQSALPGRVDLTLLRARARLRQGDYAGMRALLDGLNGRSLSIDTAQRGWHYVGHMHDRLGDPAKAAELFGEIHRTTARNMPTLDLPGEELAAALALPAGEALPNAPIFLLGVPGSNIERIAAVLADQPELVVLRDRVAGDGQRFDDEFGTPQFIRYGANFSDNEAKLARERYFAELAQRTRRQGQVIDWIPAWDANWLAFVRRALPGARLLIVDRDPRDAYLHWLGYGWTIGYPCDESAAAWLSRARAHLALGADLADPARLVIDPEVVTTDPEGTVGTELARFVGLEKLRRGLLFERLDNGLGGLPLRFAPGHWQAYQDVLAEQFAQVMA